MTGEQLTIFGIAAALLYFGTSAYKAYLSNKVTIRSKELDSNEKAVLADQIGTLSVQETARTKIMADAIAREVALGADAQRWGPF